MRFSVHIKSWNTARGYGFIDPSGGGQEIFLHISAVPGELRPPKIGQHFTFEIQLNRDGKKRAANLGVERASPTRRREHVELPARWSAGSALAIPAFLAIYGGLAMTHGVSLWFAAAYA